LFSACQSSENSNTDSSTSTEEKTSNEASKASNLKSLKQAAKEQRKATEAKIKEAQKKQAAIEGKEGAKIDNPTLSDDNQVDVSKLSTKERILRNLRKGKLKGGNQGNPSPSKDFMQGVRSLGDMNLKIEKVGKKELSYGWYNEYQPVEEYYAFTSLDRTWAGPFSQEKGPGIEEFLLEDVQVFEAVLKSTEVVKGARPDIKITEIQFTDKTAAEAAIPKLEAISKAIFNNPKHINTFWQDENRFYLIETRAASFEPVYERAKKAFYFTVTSSK